MKTTICDGLCVLESVVANVDHGASNGLSASTERTETASPQVLMVPYRRLPDRYNPWILLASSWTMVFLKARRALETAPTI